mgnify:CR=1 FL=1
MTTFTAVYYPARGEARNLLTSRYVLSQREREFIRQHLIGVAVTYNHSGVGDVVTKLVEQGVLPTPDRVRKALSFESDASRRPIGVITDVWTSPDGADWCSFTLDAGPDSNIAYLIKEGHLRGISLTHIAGAQAVPIEASLCKTPARPGCSIRDIASTAFGAARYKGLVQRGLIPSTMAASSPVDSALEIIAGLEADKRKVVEEAFMNNHRLVQASKKDAQTAEERAKTLEEQLAKQNQVYDADIGVMKAEIEAFANTIDAVLKDRPELSGKLVACKDLGDTLNGLPLGTLRAVDNLVVCASKAMQVMQESASAADTTQRKRARVEEAPPPTPAAVATPIEPTAPMDLRSALAASFEM